MRFLISTKMISVNEFDVRKAILPVRFYYIKVRAITHPKTFSWRHLLKIDKLHLKLILPSYSKVRAKKGRNLKKSYARLQNSFKLSASGYLTQIKRLRIRR